MKLLSAIAIASLAVGSLFASRSNLLFSQNSDDQKSVTVSVDSEISDFEKAVQLIKKYEGLHQPKHYPLVGYGHLVLPGEKYSRSKAMSEAEAEKLLRKDLLKNCAVFRAWGPDSLILGVLAYNIGSGNVLRSSVSKKLKAGDRDIYSNYIAHARYRGKVNSQIQRRRIEEFETLFIKDLSKTKSSVNEVIIEESQESEKPLASVSSSPWAAIFSKTSAMLADFFTIPERFVAELRFPSAENGRDGSDLINKQNSLMACI